MMLKTNENDCIRTALVRMRKSSIACTSATAPANASRTVFALTAVLTFALAIALAATTISCSTQEKIPRYVSNDDDMYLDFKTPLAKASEPGDVFAPNDACADRFAQEPSSETRYGGATNEITYEVNSNEGTQSMPDFGNEPVQNKSQKQYFATKTSIEKSVAEIFEKNLVAPGDAAFCSNASDNAVEYKFRDGKIYILLVSTGMITDLKLEGGETISGDIAVADQSFLIIDPVFSAENGRETLHLLFRANAPNSETTMVIPTNRRTYHFKIIATDEIGMHSVSFKYDKKRTTGYDSHGNELAVAGIRNLDYDYIVSGDSKIRPVAVFSDGSSTYIQFSKRFYANDSNPALYLENSSGMNIINYTIRGNIYIVDFLLDRNECFVLISGKNKAYIEKEDYIRL